MGNCTTPAIIAAVLSTIQLVQQVAYYEKLQAKLCECIERSTRLALELFDKKKFLLNEKEKIYAKLCDIPDEPDCLDALLCASEYGIMEQGAEQMESQLASLSCYDVGAAREAIRSTLTQTFEAVVNAKVDTKRAENERIDERKRLQLAAITTSALPGYGYGQYAAALRASGAALTNEIGRTVDGINGNSTALGFALGEIIRNSQANRNENPPATLTLDSLNPRYTASSQAQTQQYTNYSDNPAIFADSGYGGL